MSPDLERVKPRPSRLADSGVPMPSLGASKALFVRGSAIREERKRILRIIAWETIRRASR